MLRLDRRSPSQVDQEIQRAFRNDASAGRFFEAQPAYYRKVAAYYVMSAKRADTRARRLIALVRRSANGERLPQYASTP